jgi:hypothetical protein
MAEPELAILLVTDSLEGIRKTLAHCRAQAGRERLEVVIAAPTSAAIGPELPELQGFGAVRVVTVADGTSGPVARAQTVRAATAPIVFFAETHAYPLPGMVEALIEAHRGPWAAVGPSMSNANPERLVSWSNLFVDYGRWVDVTERGPVDDVPGHNSAYKRDLLLAFDDELGSFLRGATFMNAELRARGHQLLLEPAAKVEHLNVSLTGWMLRERYFSSRNYAALRARRWARPRRLLYVLGSPLIPVVRLRRTLAEIRRSGHGEELLPRLLPALMLNLVAGGVGELIGYALGPGSVEFLQEVDLHRTRYLHPEERRREADESTWPRAGR